MGIRSESAPRLDPAKFRDPDRTANGERRARVDFRALETLWLNTGTLCNIACANCYIRSSPTNDALVYLTAADAASYLDELESLRLGPIEIGFTGGEPFLNPHMPDMLADALGRGHRALVLTNAMRPMMRPRVRERLRRLNERHGDRLTLRVSVDHYSRAVHDGERGEGAFEATLDGMRWLRGHGFRIDVAGRRLTGESDAEARAGFARLFAAEALPVPAGDPARLVVFPEMDDTADAPEITTACWDILGVEPADMMCATSRMVVRRKGADAPAVIACTLTPDAADFELSATLAGSFRPVALNHPHCARFCVLGGASCSA